ncbi:hypothetical protein [Flavobacterium sp. FPG59]|jgi:hypothetical protein|uniref:hypothetical protein n=1 Tax=Flavobacterium sp. FPG59 TaxID=1929267 RepID=UPI000A3B15FC|nr:hypothetical protein [Flavobacterium sp. FPG59]OUD35901.1 hypothetical protein FPG59_08600 [Flavobacterium sp. FPG59]
MKINNTLCIVAIATMLFSNLQAQTNYKFSKISASYIEASSDQSIGDRTKGLEMEYYFNLKKRYGISMSLERSSFKNVPAVFSYGDERTININEIKNYEISFKQNKTISQIVFASHFYLNLINKPKHFLYFSNGLGYNIQRITYQNFTQYTFNLKSNEAVIQNTEPTYMVKNTETVVNLSSIGYDYILPNNFSVGINIRAQLPVIRDKYFFKTGGGYDELIRLGFKVGKKF